MKATLDIPDDLYRRVKARSALEGRPVRSVAVQLFQEWLSSEPEPPEATEDALTDEDLERYPWLKITRRYVKPGMNHDLDEIKESIARGWSAEIAEKLARSEKRS